MPADTPPTPLERNYPEVRFGGYTKVDGTVSFYTRVNALLRPETILADIGCGRGKYRDDPVEMRRDLRIMKGKVARAIGIDVDPAAADNPYIDEFRQFDGGRWPLDDQSVDICISDFVLEHLSDPHAYFSEAARVLRPGGNLCFRTPNAMNYVALCSKLVPNRLHAKVLQKVQSHRKEEDVFPTYYRANTIGKLRRMLSQHGFEHAVTGHEGQPSYLAFSPAAYFLGVMHQRLAPTWMKAVIMGFGRRLPNSNGQS